ncbi:hypothetical protein BJ508DRAFT_304030 [Ascobolus immersus RN42]|uniref:Uncharacterized protein n=1 Tax=Ascobolus immersus RN42 TaxID=1160509 RepID=A0A3N4IHP3_ASCIM|nr:hypothetical protein BJ508DRAFT_304030 [Ascobolus immersus RN42]
MASFMTLPSELHYQIASLLLPPFPKPPVEPNQSTEPTGLIDAIRYRSNEYYRQRRLYEKQHQYVPEESLTGIMNLIIAFGRGPRPGTDEPKYNGMGQYMRDLYTTRVCILLKRTITTQGILCTRQVDPLQREKYEYRIQQSFQEVHFAFDTSRDSGDPSALARLGLTFKGPLWVFGLMRAYLVGVVAPVPYANCCKTRLCEMSHWLEPYWVRANRDLRNSYDGICFVEKKLKPSDEPKSELQRAVALSRLRSFGGTWEVGWEKPKPYNVLKENLEKFAFLHLPDRYHARPGLIAAYLTHGDAFGTEQDWTDDFDRSPEMFRDLLELYDGLFWSTKRAQACEYKVEALGRREVGTVPLRCTFTRNLVMRLISHVYPFGDVDSFLKSSNGLEDWF